MPVGWGDTYFQFVAGQAFDITSVPNGTYYIEVGAVPASTCSGGLYRLLVTSPGGTTPTLVQDDVTP